MNSTSVSIIIAALLIGGAFLFAQNKPIAVDTIPAQNVSIVDGQQIIDITAKGGYIPRTSTAKAGIPTILRFHTTGTFDCSSSVRIPSLGVSKYLPSTGTTDIVLTNPSVGPLLGMCAMGMYPFQITFE